jgi:holliday junction DNA helicase RuvB
MPIERFVDTEVDDVSEVEVNDEQTLRPKDLKSYVGQKQIKKNLQVAIDAAKKRGEPLDHVLLYGSPGLGKTTLAAIIAAEMGANLRITSGPAIERAGDLASLLTNLEEGDVLFIDEIHRLNRSVEEILYPAMEDFKLDIMIGKGPAAKSLRLDLQKFTIIGATTRTGALSAPLRDRFGLIYRLEYYQHDEIAEIVTRAAGIMNVSIEPPAAALLATRARLTPRIANRLLRRMRDYAELNNNGVISQIEAEAALDLLQIDHAGLDNADRLLISTIIENHRGGPVGVETLAAVIGEEKTTIEDYFEPYLLQIGFMERTPRGRKVTHKAYTHLGLPVPGDVVEHDQDTLV